MMERYLVIRNVNENSCCVIALLQAKDTHMFMEEQIDDYFPELMELPGM